MPKGRPSDEAPPARWSAGQRYSRPIATDPDERRLVAAATLRLDVATGRTVDALRAAGVESILLRGPSLAWLHPGDVRRYGDMDLLVREDQSRAAVAVLETEGFTPVLAPELLDPEKHATTWRRQDLSYVDLHVTVVGPKTPPATVWEVLARHRVEIDVGGRSVTALSRPAQLVVVALHAAQHGRDEPAPLAEVERAIALGDADDWRAARSIATELDALGAFAAGLRVHAAGRALADELELPASADLITRLRAASQPLSGIKADAIARSRGVERVRLLLREAFPGATYLRRSSPLARRGRTGLFLAALARPFVLPRRWWVARRALRAVGTDSQQR